MTPPDIAFLIPVHNGAPYVAEAIRSVLAQTVGTWRLHLLDDASTDGSRELLESFTDPRLTRTYQSRRRGLYQTLAETIPTIPAAWIAILLQDDRLKPTYLATWLELMGRHPDAAAFWSTEDLIDAHGRVITPGRDTGRLERIGPGVAAWRGLLYHGCVWAISGSLTAKPLLTANPFRGDLPHCGDYDWLLRVVRQAPLVYYERPLIEIRQHLGQTSVRHHALGRDTWESYRIIRDHVTTYSHDLPRRVAFEIGGRAAWVTWRKIGAALRRGRLLHALWLAGYLVRFVWLPVIYRARAGR